MRCLGSASAGQDVAPARPSAGVHGETPQAVLGPTPATADQPDENASGAVLAPGAAEATAGGDAAASLADASIPAHVTQTHEDIHGNQDAQGMSNDQNIARSELQDSQERGALPISRIAAGVALVTRCTASRKP